MPIKEDEYKLFSQGKPGDKEVQLADQTDVGNQGRMKFFYILIVIIFFDSVVFCFVESGLAALSITILEIIGLIVLAKSYSVKEVTDLLDQCLNAVKRT